MDQKCPYKINIANVKKVFSYYTTEPDDLLKNIERVNADLLDVYSLIDAMAGITAVYHCEAMVAFDQKNEIEMMRINMEGNANVVNDAVGKKKKKILQWW